MLVAISKKSLYRPIFESFINEKYTLCVTTDILMEYEEIVGLHLGRNLSSNLLQLIENAINVEFHNKYFKWNLIQVDQDDNKFVDCAIAADAMFLVSNDKHFNILKNIPFPKVKIITAQEFLEIIRE